MLILPLDNSLHLGGVVVLSCLFLIQLFYYIRFVLWFGIRKDKLTKGEAEGVSVVVPIYFYDEKFFESLEVVLNQNYKKYEVIAINVNTTPAVEEELGRLALKYEHLYITFLPEGNQFSKKIAITIGAKAAQYDWLLFADSSCRINSADWVGQMASQMVDKNDVVIGFGNNDYITGGLNHLFRLERVYRNIFAFAFGRAGYSVAFDGRNVAFRKKMFFDHKAFAGVMNEAFAENELLLPRYIRNKNVGIVTASGSIVKYDEYLRFGDWRDLLKKHRLVLGKYNVRRKNLFYFEISTRLLFCVFSIMLFLNNVVPQFVLILVGVRFLLQVVGFKLAIKRLGEKKILLSSLVYDLLLPVILIIGFLIELLNFKR